MSAGVGQAAGYLCTDGSKRHTGLVHGAGAAVEKAFAVAEAGGDVLDNIGVIAGAGAGAASMEVVGKAVSDRAGGELFGEALGKGAKVGVATAMDQLTESDPEKRLQALGRAGEQGAQIAVGYCLEACGLPAIEGVINEEDRKGLTFANGQYISAGTKRDSTGPVVDPLTGAVTTTNGIDVGLQGRSAVPLTKGTVNVEGNIGRSTREKVILETDGTRRRERGSLDGLRLKGEFLGNEWDMSSGEQRISKSSVRDKTWSVGKFDKVRETKTVKEEGRESLRAGASVRSNGTRNVTQRRTRKSAEYGSLESTKRSSTVTTNEEQKWRRNMRVRWNGVFKEEKTESRGTKNVTKRRTRKSAENGYLESTKRISTVTTNEDQKFRRNTHVRWDGVLEEEKTKSRGTKTYEKQKTWRGFSEKGQRSWSIEQKYRKSESGDLKIEDQVVTRYEKDRQKLFLEAQTVKFDAKSGLRKATRRTPLGDTATTYDMDTGVLTEYKARGLFTEKSFHEGLSPESSKRFHQESAKDGEVHLGAIDDKITREDIVLQILEKRDETKTRIREDVKEAFVDSFQSAADSQVRSNASKMTTADDVGAHVRALGAASGAAIHQVAANATGEVIANVASVNMPLKAREKFEGCRESMANHSSRAVMAATNTLVNRALNDDVKKDDLGEAVEEAAAAAVRSVIASEVEEALVATGSAVAGVAPSQSIVQAASGALVDYAVAGTELERKDNKLMTPDAIAHAGVQAVSDSAATAAANAALSTVSATNNLASGVIYENGRAGVRMKGGAEVAIACKTVRAGNLGNETFTGAQGRVPNGYTRGLVGLNVDAGRKDTRLGIRHGNKDISVLRREDGLGMNPDVLGGRSEKLESSLGRRQEVRVSDDTENGMHVEEGKDVWGAKLGCVWQGGVGEAIQNIENSETGESERSRVNGYLGRFFNLDMTCGTRETVKKDREGRVLEVSSTPIIFGFEMKPDSNPIFDRLFRSGERGFNGNYTPHTQPWFFGRLEKVEETPLPPGWVEAVTESGERNYYHEGTGKTTRDRPCPQRSLEG